LIKTTMINIRILFLKLAN